MSVGELWQRFAHVRGWPDWNPCMWTATVAGGPSLAAGAPPQEGRLLVWAFNPIRRRYLYRLPGMWARHTYWMEPLDGGGCRFGSWEVAEGPAYRLLRPFWLASFRFVCRQPLVGARQLARSGRDRA